MHIVKEEKDIYVFKSLEEAEKFSQYLYSCEIYEKNISSFFDKYKCLSDESNFYLIEIENSNGWEFKCLSSNKSASDLLLGEKRIIPLKMNPEFFENEEIIQCKEEDVEDIYDLIYEINEKTSEMIVKIEENNKYTQKMIIYSTTLFFIINTLKLFF